MRRILYILALALSIVACTEEIDKSNRYTFTGETVADFMLNRSEKYSHFINLLERAQLLSLLNTYGQYTLFLPDNDAVEKYVAEQDSIYHATKDSDNPVWTGVTSPLVEDLSDSMAVVLANTHIVEGCFSTSNLGEGSVAQWNFDNHYLGINYVVDGENYYIMINNYSRIMTRDEYVENGIIHTLDKAINPASFSLPGHIGRYNYFSLFSAALQLTGLGDSLLKYNDNSYVAPEKYSISGNQLNIPEDYVSIPEKKFYRYTAFVETDDVFHKQGIENIDDLVAFAEKWYGTEDRGNFESPRNALNKFVAYHIIEGEYPSNKILPQGEKYDIALGKKYPRVDYFETMQGTLMKVVKPYGTQDAANIYINYSKREIPYNPELHHHLNVRLIETTEFTQADLRHSDFVQNALNGVVQPIDKILIYNENEMVGNILNERMRFDFFSMLPELSSNNVRYYYLQNEGANLQTIIPDGYCRNIKSNTNKFQIYAFTGYYPCLNIDNITPVGTFALSFRLPPVPSRTYEIRFSCSFRGGYWKDEPIVQIYIDGKICGLPIDFRMNADDPRIGWIPDEATNDNGIENDKQMRNRGWMKAPDSYYNGAGMPMRNFNHTLRRIIDKRHLGDGEHWIRFRNISEVANTEFFNFDYIELVPLNIISDPNKPEDRH